MSWWEILIIVAAAAFVVGVIVMSVIRKKQGKTSCDCGCGGNCAACHGCASSKEPRSQK